MRATFRGVALLALAAPAVGIPTFEYVSRFSRVQIYGELPGAPPPNDYYYASFSTTDFGPFDESVEDEVIWEGVSAASDASQTSSLAPAALSATRWTHMELLSDDGTGTASAWAPRELEVVFDLVQAAPIEPTGWVHTPPGSGPPSDLACEVALSQRVGAGERNFAGRGNHL
jgi:hypothetical protein